MLNTSIIGARHIPCATRGISAAYAYVGVVSNGLGGANASKGSVTIVSDPNGRNHAHSHVYGGAADYADATDNKVVMNGGSVTWITGGFTGYEVAAVPGHSTACRNTVIINGGMATVVRGGEGDHACDNMVVMHDGNVDEIIGGYAFGGEHPSGGKPNSEAACDQLSLARNNVVIVTGGTIRGLSASFVVRPFLGDSSSTGYAATDNSIHLVGEGYAGVIEGESVTGTANIRVHTIYPTKTINGEDAHFSEVKNSCLHLYGSGIVVSTRISNVDRVSFHLTKNLLAAAPMLQYDGTQEAFSLAGRELSFNADMADWDTFSGKTITLVSSPNMQIEGLKGDREVSVAFGESNARSSARRPAVNGDSRPAGGPAVVYSSKMAAILRLADGGKRLELTFKDTSNHTVISGASDTYRSGNLGYESSNRNIAYQHIGVASIGRDEGNASNASVSVVRHSRGQDHSQSRIYGGWSEFADSTDNKIVMNGGQVDGLIGGEAYSGYANKAALRNTVVVKAGIMKDITGGMGCLACDNKVIMHGGETDILIGGYSTGTDSCFTDVLNGIVTGERLPVAKNNVVIVTGGTIRSLFAATVASHQTSLIDNSIHLVGEGYSGTVAGESVTGSANISIGTITPLSHIRVCCPSEENEIKNYSLHLYGSGTSIHSIELVDSINFHLSDELRLSVPMLQYGSPGVAIVLSLADKQLAFFGGKVTNWSAFSGKTITLINAYKIDGLEGEKEVIIRNSSGTAVATATLRLADGGKKLELAFAKQEQESKGDIRETLPINRIGQYVLPKPLDKVKQDVIPKLERDVLPKPLGKVTRKMPEREV